MVAAAANWSPPDMIDTPTTAKLLRDTCALLAKFADEARQSTINPDWLATLRRAKVRCSTVHFTPANPYVQGNLAATGSRSALAVEYINILDRHIIDLERAFARPSLKRDRVDSTEQETKRQRMSDGDGVSMLGRVGMFPHAGSEVDKKRSGEDSRGQVLQSAQQPGSAGAHKLTAEQIAVLNSLYEPLRFCEWSVYCIGRRRLF